MSSPPSLGILAVASAVAVLGLLLPSEPARSEVPAPPRHLIVVSIDTLRADYLGAYGHPYVESPHIDAVAADGVLFERHVAAAPTTLASHTSLMTGTWPHTHGVPRNGFRIHEGNRMLAEHLRDHGFQTAAFIGAFPLSRRFAFDQGFDHFDERFGLEAEPGVRDQTQRPADEVTDAALAWLRGRDRDDRLFLFVHYFDVHAPYTPPGRFARLYRDDDSSVTGGMEDVKRARTDAERENPSRLHDLLKRQYAAGVTWVDHEVGRLLDGLRASGLLDDALLVVTSDHGEAMDEHWERWNHGFSTFETTVRVPLIVRLPGGAGGGRRVDALVSNIDVMPSVLEVLGLPVPASSEGLSFAPVLRGEPAPAPREIAFSEATKPARDDAETDPVWRNALKCRSAQTARWKVVHLPRSDETWLYDLRADPGEQHDRAGDEPERAARLLEELSAWSASARPRDGRYDVDPETRRRLEALGYTSEPMPER